MSLEGEKPESLRDTIGAAFDEHVPPPESDQSADTGTPAAPAEAAPEAAPKPGRTAGRARGPDGKLLPGKAQQAPEAPTISAPAVTPAAPARPPRPSSWKKEYWEHWDKIDPSVASYIAQRESEYAKGVSTYKSEWDRVQPMAQAMAQFEPLLQQHNIRPDTWITNLGNAHKSLALGTPEQKASMFVKLAQDYQIPIESLFVQGQDGKLYFNPQIQPHQPAQQQQQAQQPDVRELVRQELLEHQTKSEIQNFVSATGSDGQPKHPYFEDVRETMERLLAANLATDLEDAYNQALALPRHAELTAQIRAQEAKAEADRNAAERAKQVARARGNTISPKTSTPTVSGADRPKGVRASIEAAYDSVIGSGRV